MTTKKLSKQDELQNQMRIACIGFAALIHEYGKPIEIMQSAIDALPESFRLTFKETVNGRAFYVESDNDTTADDEFYNDRDEWREPRRCPDCHDDATAYNVSACPTCMGEGYI